MTSWVPRFLYFFKLLLLLKNIMMTSSLFSTQAPQILSSLITVNKKKLTFHPPPLLHFLIIRNTNGSQCIDWYNKPTYLGRLLNFFSQHPYHQSINTNQRPYSQIPLSKSNQSDPTKSTPSALKKKKNLL